MLGDLKDDMTDTHARNGVPKSQRPKRPKKPKAENQLAPVIRAWLNGVLSHTDSETAADAVETLVAQAPKRWVIYEPMVLLPTGSFGFACVPGQAAPDGGNGPTWPRVLASASDAQTSALWRDMLAVLSRGAARLTHLAVNEGIPLHVDADDGADADQRETEKERENILRSPTGLRPLYGDFGPATTERGRDDDPSDADMAAAFWVSTKQNGLYQTWAPRWSMFSRGNVKEKARLLAWPCTTAATAASSAADTRATALDLYAGIGYFVFSYAQRGLRVLGWELNAWSTEALRRGAVRNGWTVQIVRGAALAQPTADVVDGRAAIVIFVEDNQNAARRLAELRQTATRLAIVHVNGGLLPTSRPVWRTAWDAVVDSRSDTPGTHTGWLHLHDNVGVDELDRRAAEIQALVDAWGASAGGAVASVVEHTELVKTFAPGVWHCVFDVRVCTRF